MAKNLHKSVLLDAVVAHMPLASSTQIADVTLGGGGHTLALVKEIISKGLKNISILALDVDAQAWHFLRTSLQAQAIQTVKISDSQISFAKNNRIIFRQQNFAQLAQAVKANLPESKLDGILADLGPSQNLLEDESMGLSFRKEAILDMRLDKQLAVTAADLLQVLSKKQLRQMFDQYADLKHALRLAELIVDTRQERAITTTTQLNQLVLQLMREKEITAAVSQQLAKVYQALRIAVNLEFTNLSELLVQAWQLLKPEAKLLVITFHSGEEKLVTGTIPAVPQRIIKPSSREVKQNPRSRSARLYIYQR